VDALRFEELLRQPRVASREATQTLRRSRLPWRFASDAGPPLHGLTKTPWFSGEARLQAAILAHDPAIRAEMTSGPLGRTRTPATPHVRARLTPDRGDHRL
jgi:hypothetical protein